MTISTVIAIVSIGFNVVLVVAVLKFESVKVNHRVDVEVNGRKWISKGTK